MTSLFLLVSLLLVLFIGWALYHDYIRKCKALHFIIVEKHKDDKSSNWLDDYERERLKLSDCLISQLRSVFFVALVCGVVGLLICIFH